MCSVSRRYVSRLACPSVSAAYVQHELDKANKDTKHYESDFSASLYFDVEKQADNLSSTLSEEDENWKELRSRVALSSAYSTDSSDNEEGLKMQELAPKKRVKVQRRRRKKRARGSGVGGAQLAEGNEGFLAISSDWSSEKWSSSEG